MRPRIHLAVEKLHLTARYLLTVRVGECDGKIEHNRDRRVCGLPGTGHCWLIRRQAKEHDRFVRLWHFRARQHIRFNANALRTKYPEQILEYFPMRGLRPSECRQ